MAKSDTKGTDFKSSMSSLEETLEVYLVDKAPKLPENIKEIIVKFAPWISLIVLVVTLPAILLAFGLGALVAPFAFLGGLHAGVSFGVGMLFGAVILVLEALAIPGLFGRKRSAWNLLFYASILGAVQNLISFNLGGLIIGTLVSFYFLFQVNSYYK